MKIPHNSQVARVENNNKISTKAKARAKRMAYSKKIQAMDEFININSNIRDTEFKPQHVRPNATFKAPKTI